MIKNAIETVITGQSLTGGEAEAAMIQIMSGGASPSQIAALLTALRMKGETVDEITGFARVMRAQSVRVPTTRTPLVDTCGTGGDICKTFNVSTTAAFVAAGAGVAVAKHGNRSVTSKCGSADVLEALGVRLDLHPEDVGRCIDEVGIGFLFARNHHPAMKHAAVPRAEMGVRTIFNALGPLTNPAGATRQVVGVYSADLCETLANVLANLGAEHVLVVHGKAGLDEIATWGETLVAEHRNGCTTTYTVTPHSLGLGEASPQAVAPGRDARENAEILGAVLSGDDRGPRRELVLANAAAALLVGGAVETLVEGVALAGQTIDSGKAIQAAQSLREWTQQAAAAQTEGGTAS